MKRHKSPKRKGKQRLMAETRVRGFSGTKPRRIGMALTKKSSSSRGQLLQLFCYLHKVPNERYLQNLVFLAQYTKVLPPIYNFRDSTASYALPFSFHLEADLLSLKNSGYIFDTKLRSSFVITKKATARMGTQRSSAASLLNRINQLSEEEIGKLVAVARSREIFQDVGVKKTQLTSKIAGYLLLEPSEVQQSCRLLDRLTSLGK